MFIPGGAIVISNIREMRALKEYYEDPFAFKPEHFIVGNAPTDPHNYAFGSGRRICPGNGVASATAFMSIVCTLHCFGISKATINKERILDDWVRDARLWFFTSFLALVVI